MNLGDILRKLMVITVLILLAPILSAGEPFKIISDVPRYVRPGDTFTVSVSIQNKTGDNQNDVRVTLLVTPPFDIVGDREFVMGDFDEFINMRVAVFKLQVRQSALYGFYDIPILIKSQTIEYRDKLTIKVLGTTLVNVSKISVDKEKVFPGDTFVLDALVENKGNNGFKWLKVSLNSNPSSMPNPPLIPLTSTETVFLNMASGARREASFSISVGKDTKPQSYPLLLIISYQDEADVKGSYEVPYGLDVSGKSSLVFASIEPEPAEPTENDTVVLNVSIKNTGHVTAKSVKGTLAYEGGKLSSFIPDIDKDESGTLLFNVDRMKEGKHDFKVEITWTDEYGQKGEIYESWTLTVKKEEKSYSGYLLPVIILLAVIIGYFIKKKIEIGMTLRNLFRRKTRSFLTIAGIAVGIGLVIILLQMSSAISATMGAMFEKGGADITVTQKNAADLILSQVKESDIEEMKKILGVDDVSSVLVAVEQQQDMPYFIIFGLYPDEFEIKQYKIISGRGLNQSDAKKIIIGKGTADTLKLSVGKKIKALGGQDYEIVGIYETGMPWQDSGGVTHIKDVQRALGVEDTASWVSIKSREVESTEKRIDRRFSSLQATKSSEIVGEAQDAQMLNAIAGFISIVAFVVGGIAVMNTMVMSVIERTREIGVLRALGWGRFRIVGMIMKESVLISLIGATIGTILGLAFVQFLKNVSPIPLSFPFSLSFIFSALLIAVSLGLIGGVYPAWRASKLSPIEALRYE